MPSPTVRSIADVLDILRAAGLPVSEPGGQLGTLPGVQLDLVQADPSVGGRAVMADANVIVAVPLMPANNQFTALEEHAATVWYTLMEAGGFLFTPTNDIGVEYDAGGNPAALTLSIGVSWPWLNICDNPNLKGSD